MKTLTVEREQVRVSSSNTRLLWSRTEQSAPHSRRLAMLVRVVTGISDQVSWGMGILWNRVALSGSPAPYRNRITEFEDLHKIYSFLQNFYIVYLIQI